MKTQKQEIKKFECFPADSRGTVYLDGGFQVSGGTEFGTNLINEGIEYVCPHLVGCESLWLRGDDCPVCGVMDNLLMVVRDGYSIVDCNFCQLTTEDSLKDPSKPAYWFGGIRSCGGADFEFPTTAVINVPMTMILHTNERIGKLLEEYTNCKNEPRKKRLKADITIQCFLVFLQSGEFEEYWSLNSFCKKWDISHEEIYHALKG